MKTPIKTTSKVRFTHALRVVLLLTLLPQQLLAANMPWEPMGPTAATIFSLVRDPLSPGRLYAGTHFGGVYRSTDGGLHWTPLDAPFANNTIFSIAIDPVTPDNIYIGTFSNGIFYSGNGGNSWNPVNIGLASLNIAALVVDPVNSNHVVAATAFGVYVSNDKGASWNAATSGLINVATRSLVYDNADPGRLYAGTSGLGVWVSVDGGNDWTPVGTATSNRTVTALTIDPNAPGNLYASASDGAFHLAAGSSTWKNITFDLPDTRINQLMPRPLDDGLFAATDNGIFVLDNAGDSSWQQWNPLQASLILPDPSGNWLHLAGRFSQLLLTTDDGTTFIDVANGIQNRFVGSLETLSVGNTTILYAGSNEGLEFTTESYTDGIRQFWIPVPAFGGTIFDIESSISVPGSLYLGTERDGVWKSTDYGNTWSRKSRGIVPTLTFSFDQASTAAATLYAGTSSGIFISKDDGLNWQPDNNTSTPRQVLAVAADPVRKGVARYGTADGRIYRTLDSGNSFNEVWQTPDGSAILQIKAAPYFNVYAVSSSGDLYVSTDVGVNFFKRAPEITDPVLSVTVDWQRPWIAWVGTLFGGVWKSETNAINWTQQSNGIDIPIIFSLTVDPTDSAVLYAGGKGVIYRSSDGGANWNRLDNGLPDQFISSIGIDPANSSRLYVSIEDAGIYISNDTGLNWSSRDSGASMNGRTPLLVTTTGTLLTSSPGLGVLRSNDSGASWTPASDGMTLFVRTVAASPVDPQVVYAGSLDSGVFKSVDGGDNWEPKGLTDRNIFSIVISPANPDTLYAGSSLGIERSLDGGQSWQSIANRDSYIFDLVSDPADPERVFAAGLAGQVFISDDGGVGWRIAASGLPAENILALHLDTSTGDLYAGTERVGVFRLPSGAQAWTRTNLNILTSTKVTALTTGQAGDLYAATSGEGLFRSSDSGTSWQPLPVGNDQVFDIAQDPFVANRLFAITLSSDGTGSGLSRSDDGGQNWVLTSLPLPNAFALTLSPHVAGQIFVAVSDRVYQSDDGGVTWSLAGNGIAGAKIRALQADPNVPGVVLAGAIDGRIFITTDNGASWQAAATTANGSITAFAPGPGAVSVYAASLGNGVSRSNDGGMNWGQGAGVGIFNIPVLFLAINPQTPTTLYAATGGKGLLKSTDSGATWLSANNGLDANLLLSLHIDPGDPRILYVGSANQGFYISEDSAATWRSENQGLINHSVTSIATDILDPGRIYVGTEGGGIYRSRRSPSTP